MNGRGLIRFLLAVVILFSVGGCTEQVHTCTAIGTIGPDGQKPPGCP
jgi:hypothetical protein